MASTDLRINEQIRESEVRLLVAVQYLQRGASVVLSDNSFEAI